MRFAATFIVAAVAAMEAAAECRALEFAELESMRAEQVVALRCDYRRQMLAYVDAAHAASGRSVLAAQGGLAQANRCAQELTRLDRILGRKLGLSGGDDAISVHVNGLCR